MEDDAKERRGFALKDWAQLVMVAIALAGIFWRGGQFMSELTAISTVVTKIDARQEAFAQQQSQDRSDLRVLQERYQALEGRVNRMESR
jgi:outer membrane murein-binding lipoprotein Lpp